MQWNPAWKKPKNMMIDKNGFMSVWYLDGNDEPVEESAVDKLYHAHVAGR